MDGRTGREGGRTREPTGRVGGRTGNQDGQGGNRGNHASNIQGDVRNVSMSNGQNGCLYKEFMACSPKDYDGKGVAIAYTHWIEKMESVQDMSGGGVNQKVKYTARSFISKALTWWNTQVQNRGQEAIIGMIWEDVKVLIRKEFCPNNEIQKLETEFWCHAMVGAGHTVYTDRLHELVRLVPHLVTSKKKGLRGSRVGMEMLGMTTRDLGLGRHFPQPLTLLEESKRVPHPSDYRARPRMVNPVNANNLTTTRGGKTKDGTDHYKAACPRLNRSLGQGGNLPNQVLAIDGGQEINKVIRGCKLEIEGHTFDIDLIPFRHEIFDVIVGMYWLSKHKAKIFCHETVVRILIPNGKILRVLGEKPKEKMRRLMSAKAEEQKLKDIVLVRNFPESPYRLAPSEMEELSSQVREL
nr:hypothetical protein [Tanacetum cinerariifolium]